MSEGTYNYQQISEGFNDGLQIGNSTTDKVGLFGATPVVQQTITHLVTATDGTTACNAAVAELQLAFGLLGLTNVHT